MKIPQSFFTNTNNNEQKQIKSPDDVREQIQSPDDVRTALLNPISAQALKIQIMKNAMTRSSKLPSPASQGVTVYQTALNLLNKFTVTAENVLDENLSKEYSELNSENQIARKF